VVAHLDLDSFFIAVERARDPSLRGRPVIVGGRPDGRGLVAAASREARRDGVRTGLPLDAAALRCPGAAFLEGSLDAYLDAAREVDAILRRHTPIVEWISVDEAFIEWPGARSGSALRAIDEIEQIRRDVAALGLDVACGLAQSKLVARVASRLAHPRGLVHVLDGYEPRFLSPLKIEVLPGLDPVVARRLRAAGIRRIGQVARLTEAQMSALAGRAGAAIARQAAGIDRGHVRPTPLPVTPLADEDLAAPTADRATLESALGRRVERAAHDLRRRGAFARSLTLRIRYADGRVDSRSASLREPSALDDVLVAIAIDLLTRILRPERLVRSIGVTCGGIVTADRGLRLFPSRL
jgi:DNA polymerase IV